MEQGKEKSTEPLPVVNPAMKFIFKNAGYKEFKTATEYIDLRVLFYRFANCGVSD